MVNVRPMTLRSGRMVLGDISNRRANPSGDDKQGKKPKLSHHGSAISIHEDVDDADEMDEVAADGTLVVREEELDYDIDRSAVEDPLQCVRLLKEMYEYYYDAEVGAANPMYMHSQNDINPKMRAILIDWLVEVHMKFRLASPTLYLTVFLIDRYCSIEQVLRARLQLVGVTALLIACKYEEIYPPEVSDCVYITDQAYTHKEVLEMETKILEALRYKITVPNSHYFLVRNMRIISVTEITRHRANYFAQRTLQEHDMLCYRPSMIAAAATHLALSMDETAPSWPEELLDFTGYTAEQLRPCCHQIANHINRSPTTASKRQLNAVKKKFASPKYLEISNELVAPIL